MASTVGKEDITSLQPELRYEDAVLGWLARVL